MPTANEEYFDAAIRHQIGIRRLASGEAKEMLALLEKADRELVAKLRARLARLGGSQNVTTKRFRELIRDIRAARRGIMLELRRRFSPNLVELAKMEVDFERRMLGAAIPVEVGLAQVSVDQVRAAIFSRPFQGRLLREWFNSLERADAARLSEAVQLGVAQGEPINDIVRRVAGTRAGRFRDGALSITRRNAESVVRTAVNHVTNAARETVWEANADIVEMLRWTSTLDGRTSPVCRGRDGKFAPVGDRPLPKGTPRLDPPSARPPAHVGCRSVMVAVLDGQGIVGQRPTVRDSRLPGRRELDFRAESRRTGKSVRQLRAEWAAANVGQAPGATTYNQWLRRQPASFQDEVLGKTKGALFRRGKLPVDRYVDRRGNELTIEELRRTEPEAFELAGL